VRPKKARSRSSSRDVPIGQEDKERRFEKLPDDAFPPLSFPLFIETTHAREAQEWIMIGLADPPPPPLFSPSLSLLRDGYPPGYARIAADDWRETARRFQRRPFLFSEKHVDSRVEKPGGKRVPPSLSPFRKLMAGARPMHVR